MSLNVYPYFNGNVQVGHRAFIWISKGKHKSKTFTLKKYPTLDDTLEAGKQYVHMLRQRYQKPVIEVPSYTGSRAGPVNPYTRVKGITLCISHSGLKYNAQGDPWVSVYVGFKIDGDTKMISVRKRGLEKAWGLAVAAFAALHRIDPVDVLMLLNNPPDRGNIIDAIQQRLHNKTQDGTLLADACARITREQIEGWIKP